MKTTHKNAYRAFAPRGNYRAGCLGFLVTLQLLQCLSLALLEFSFSAAINIILLPVYLVVSDVRIFGGSCSGQSALSGYINTSARGSDILRKALIQDCIFRFAVTILFVALSAAEEWFFLTGRPDHMLYEPDWFFLTYPSDQGIFAPEALLRILQIILVTYAASMLCSLISRHFIHIIWYFVFGYLAADIVCIAFMDARNGAPLILSILLGAVCSVLFSVITVKLTLNKMRRSYYDKTVEI